MKYYRFTYGQMNDMMVYAYSKPKRQDLTDLLINGRPELLPGGEISADDMIDVLMEVREVKRFSAPRFCTVLNKAFKRDEP